MLLMAFVMSYLYQQYLIPTVSKKAHLISNLIFAWQASDARKNVPNEERDLSKKKIIGLLSKDNCMGAYIKGSQHQEIFAYAKSEGLLRILKRDAAQSLERGGRQESLSGSLWRDMWDKSGMLISSHPVMNEDTTVAGASIAFSLTPALERMREIQRIGFLYLMLNTALFAAIGFSPLYRFTIKPLRKLTQRTSQYRFGDGLLMAFRGSGSEWDGLYRAVNRIIALNTEDNQKLKDTVQSLQCALKDLGAAQQEIIRAEKLATVGRLASGLAHEIGNPIGIIIGYIELLKAGNLPEEEIADVLRRMEDEVRRVDRIIRQMLDFSRPKGLDVKVVSAHEVINSMIEMMRVQPLFSGIALHEDLEAEEDHVSADPEQLRQAFLNIMLNAVDAIETEKSGRRGRLSISSENIVGDMKAGSERRMIQLSFSDNGTGISREYMENIFDPFFTTKSPQKGCGLGLWVSTMIIEGAGGSLSVDSQDGVGTTMYIRLPILR
jgi:signal transduction histidine kinase